jgi:hypothetical protein
MAGNSLEFAYKPLRLFSKPPCYLTSPPSTDYPEPDNRTPQTTMAIATCKLAFPVLFSGLQR